MLPACALGAPAAQQEQLLSLVKVNRQHVEGTRGFGWTGPQAPGGHHCVD
jgi:hypothetical protein